ncbi:MAG: hypothetical protein WHX52_20265 [Anaerolineae bacterium]
MQTVRIIINAAKAFYEEMLFFIATGGILLAATFLVIPMPFALIGVWMVAHRAVRGLGVNWGLYWRAVKEYGLRALQLTLVLALGYGLLVANIWFYNTPGVSGFSDSVLVWIRPIVLIIGLVWIGISFYAHAFLIELEEPKLLMILRSSLALTFVNPVTTLLLLIVSVLLTALSIVVPVLLLALPGFIATLSITAVRTLIAAVSEKYGAGEEKQATE